jgi:hypothetical protein
MKIIFRKDKYEQDFINKYGAERLLFIKLNPSMNDDWADVLDGQDITGNMTPVFQNGEEIYHVCWKTVEEISFGAQLYCFVTAAWCDFVED